MLYKPSKSSFNPIPEPSPAKPADRPSIQSATPLAPLPKKPALDLPSQSCEPSVRPSIETRTLERLEQQNRDLRTLLEQTNISLINARAELSTLTRTLHGFVVINKPPQETLSKLKQSLIELNKVLNNG